MSADGIAIVSRSAKVMRAASSAGASGLRAHIQRSWTRCVNEFAIRPESERDTFVLPGDQLQERRQRLAGILETARCEMENLYELIIGTGYAVILSDADGVILETVSDPVLKRKFRRAGLWLGAKWDERHEGTNGIGTCLAEGSPISVHREEHFRNYNTRLSCSCAPIQNARGELIAALDASSTSSSDSGEIYRHTVALVSMSASLISRCQFLDESRDAWVLRFHSRAEFVGLLHEALIAIDADGRVLAANESALLQLGLDARERILGHPIETVFQFTAATLQHRAVNDANVIWPIRDVAHGRRFFARIRAPQVSPVNHQPNLARVTGVPAGHGTGAMVAADPCMRGNLERGRQLFAKQVPILLSGPTGSGKDVFARTLHTTGLWSERAFVAVNCAAIPENLIESELFGYRPGAFTGAAREGHRGMLQQSSSGTLFLDEIGDMPLQLQARLLRVIETREVTPIGSDHALPVDLHVISATHHDLLQMVRQGLFREDLYYRLAGITLTLPALAERQDKRELILTVLREECDAEAPLRIAEDALQRLLTCKWPGNIRQLRNVLRIAAALCDRDTIRLSNLPQEIVALAEPAAPLATAATPPDIPVDDPLRAAERAALVTVLAQHGGNISHTARALRIGRNTLYRKLQRHGIALRHAESPDP